MGWEKEGRIARCGEEGYDERKGDRKCMGWE